MSLAVRDAIRRRGALRGARFSPTPLSGQIVLIERQVSMESRGPEPARPAAVLLMDSAGKGIWDGFVVGSETDYATCWDLVLEPDDEPIDPVAGMVQVWNPVCISVPEQAVVLGELSSERVAALRALTSEFARGTRGSAGPSRAGWVGTRHVDGYSILTGTPLGEEDDPRRAYQRIYTRVAAEISRPAAEEREDRRLAALVTKVARGLEQWAARAGIGVAPVEAIPQPLGEQLTEVEIGYRLGADIKLELMPHVAEPALQIRVVLLGTSPVDVVLRQGDEVLQHFRLEQSGASSNLFLDFEEPYVLGIQMSDAGVDYEIPLT